MAVVGIIPARLASTRFPRKLLVSGTGHPLVRHVYDAAAAAPMLDRVIIATEDDEVVDAVRSFGGEAVMTGSHPNGTSRLAEAAKQLGLAEVDVVVNIQGDEPELDPAAIEAAVRALAVGEAGDRQVGTVAAPLASPDEFTDPNVVKVVTDCAGRALLFSRAPIPHPREGAQEPGAEPLRHVGLYSYTVGFLARYVTLDETPLERTERLEQLRVLEHGYTIGVERVARAHAGIDTPEQYAAFVARWRSRQGS